MALEIDIWPLPLPPIPREKPAAPRSFLVYESGTGRSTIDPLVVFSGPGFTDGELSAIGFGEADAGGGMKWLLIGAVVAGLGVLLWLRG